MNTIERIRAATHVRDLEVIDGHDDMVLLAARDTSDPAHHYLAANLTPELRARLVDRLASLMELDSKVSFEDWRITLPSMYAPDMVVCLPHHIADAAWLVWARRDLCALAWIGHDHGDALFLAYHDPAGHWADFLDSLDDLCHCIEYGDVLEAQRIRSRVALEMPGYMRPSQAKYKRRVFAEAILDLWLGRDDLGLMEIVGEMRAAYYADALGGTL